METQTFSKKEKEEIIRYGLDRIKSTCTMTLVTLLMGCIFQVFFQSIVFLVCFIVLRKYAGGYHADTQNRCYVISTAIIAVALLAIRYMSDGSDNEIFILLQSLNFIILLLQRLIMYIIRIKVDMQKRYYFGQGVMKMQHLIQEVM